MHFADQVFTSNDRGTSVVFALHDDSMNDCAMAGPTKFKASPIDPVSSVAPEIRQNQHRRCFYVGKTHKASIVIDLVLLNASATMR